MKPDSVFGAVYGIGRYTLDGNTRGLAYGPFEEAGSLQEAQRTSNSPDLLRRTCQPWISLPSFRVRLWLCSVGSEVEPGLASLARSKLPVAYTLERSAAAVYFLAEIPKFGLGDALHAPSVRGGLRPEQPGGLVPYLETSPWAWKEETRRFRTELNLSVRANATGGVT